MAEGNIPNFLNVVNGAPPNVVNTSTPEDIYNNATKTVIYIWSGWGPMTYTPTTSGNYWTYIFIRCSEKNYSIFFVMASGNLYKYNFSGSAWVKYEIAS